MISGKQEDAIIVHKHILIFRYYTYNHRVTNTNTIIHFKMRFRRYKIATHSLNLEQLKAL
ncbi:hypothetical protein BOO23_00590 [Vibrio navarrensis]|nr:hypothetical protein [Vibrio navarrensis]